MKTRDHDRRRINCCDCRFHDPEDKLCPVARKIPVTKTGQTTTCQRFKPHRRRALDSGPPPPPKRFIVDPEQAAARLDASGLAWAVLELTLIGERLAIRYHPRAMPNDMQAVARVLEAGPIQR